jgi:hypothetical protein
MTVVTTLILEVLLSAQLLLLQSNFSQQTKDTAVIHKEVLSEYDLKYVHPRLSPLVRDVGTQYSGPVSATRVEEERDVETYTPTIILKRGFRTNPNPNYAKYIDPDNTGAIPQRTAFSPTSAFKTPAAYGFREPTPLRTPHTTIRQPQFQQSTSGAVSTGTSTGDGGSLGVYSHANSPLKKATSMFDIQGGGRDRHRDAPRNSYDLASREIQDEKERSMSPVKRQRDLEQEIAARRTSVPSGFGMKPRPSRPDSVGVDNSYKRGPSRW